ncbi:MAG: hypothetical protein IPJ81_15825 [Chitinophagaceae bacterium]|nr:hypothetical protein [Chitinophagaceae bacterium]
MSKSIIRRFSKFFFITTNILAAIIFLLGCYSKFFDNKYWWFIGFFNLASFYLLLVLGAYFLFWLFVKPRWSLISLICVLLAITPVRNIIPFRFSSGFSINKPPNSLRVMSWNVAQFDILNFKKNPQVKQKMLDLINEYKPDIACFQEMVCGDSTVDLNTPYYQKYSFYRLQEFSALLNFPEHFLCL